MGVCNDASRWTGKQNKTISLKLPVVDFVSWIS